MATSMIITTNNLTIERMAVIACRTHSELMAGAKAMLIETAKRQMASGVCHFAYTKKNGEYREAWELLFPLSSIRRLSALVPAVRTMPRQLTGIAKNRLGVVSAGKTSSLCIRQ